MMHKIWPKWKKTSTKRSKLESSEIQITGGAKKKLWLGRLLYILLAVFETADGNGYLAPPKHNLCPVVAVLVIRFFFVFLGGFVYHVKQVETQSAITWFCVQKSRSQAYKRQRIERLRAGIKFQFFAFELSLLHLSPGVKKVFCQGSGSIRS